MTLQNKPIIIFDFMRTLYDPESGLLYAGVHELLQECIKREFDLFLVSRLEGQRMEIMKQLGIDGYFKEIILLANKRNAIHKIYIDNPEVKIMVVGDVVQEEIVYGNECGATTVWLRKGKFKDDTPYGKNGEPNHTIERITDLLELLK